MVRAPKAKVKPIGVREAARRLCVNHGHLSRVLRGERVSRLLLRRYRSLLKEAA